MNLVDILARELEEWPIKFGEYAISAPTEGTFAVWFNDRRPYPHKGGWADIGCVELWLQEEPEDRNTAIVTRDQWQAAVDALADFDKNITSTMTPEGKIIVAGRDMSKDWHLGCIPPVGATCERRFPDIEGSSWMGGIVLAHGAKTVFFRDNCGDEWAHPIDDVEFRPFPNPEQIAADERARFIDELREFGSVTNKIDDVFGMIYDAGYRKQKDA